MRLLFLILFFVGSKLNGQPINSKLDVEVLEFCSRMESIYGTVFFDTTYKKYDVTGLKKSIRDDSLPSTFSIIQSLDMKLSDFSFKAIAAKLNNISSVDCFFKKKDEDISFTPYESSYNKKIDSTIQFINTSAVNHENLPSEIKDIENLLIESSYWKKSSLKRNVAKKKIIGLLSIFESKQYFLFVYTLSELHSTLHTYPQYELIIK